MATPMAITIMFVVVPCKGARRKSEKDRRVGGEQSEKEEAPGKMRKKGEAGESAKIGRLIKPE